MLINCINIIIFCVASFVLVLLIKKNKKNKLERINKECNVYIEEVKKLSKDYNKLFLSEDIISEIEIISLMEEGNSIKNNIVNFLYAKGGKIRNTPNYNRLVSRLDYISETFDNRELQIALKKHNDEIEKRICKKVNDIIGCIEGRKLDKNQLIAIHKESHNQLIIAGAGTGKTTTIIGKVKYLIKTKKYKPEEILLLSFTNAQATEIGERVKKELGVTVEAKTFHKLGLDIISEANGKRPIISKITAKDVINTYIDKLSKNDEYVKGLYSYYTDGFNTGCEKFFSTQKEYTEYLKENAPITLRGEKVKSYGEVIIANFLYLNGVNYEYEYPYKVDTRTKYYSQYYPDFYLVDSDIYIEYFAIDKYGRVPSWFKNGYVEQMRWKRNLHKNNNTKMIESYYYENIDGTLVQHLKNNLIKNGVELKPMKSQKIFNVINQKNYGYIDSLKKLFEMAINLMKSNNYNMEYMKKICNEDIRKRTNLRLLKLIEPFWNEYNKLLKENGEIDFNDMINLATLEIRNKNYISPYKMVIVDEYQDISKARYNLLKELRNSSDYRLLCVGDDWQSIYRFAGSDINFIREFSKYWGDTQIDFIENTYRFSQQLVDISGRFIMKNPLQIIKNIVGLKAEEDNLEIICGYEVENAIEVICNKLNGLPKNSSVFLVGRYNIDKKMLEGFKDIVFKFDNINKSLKVIYSKRRDLNIQFITAHRSKGLQADYVFIINNLDGDLGFPSEICDDPLLEMLLEKCDNYVFAEERRLFYVALTRAKKKVFLVTIKGRESFFIREIKRILNSVLGWEKYCPLCGGELLMRKGKHGNFYGCENYNKKGCTYTRQII